MSLLCYMVQFQHTVQLRSTTILLCTYAEQVQRSSEMNIVEDKIYFKSIILF